MSTTIEYLWLIGKEGNRLKLCNWNGDKVELIDPKSCSMKPDLKFGAPVLNFIGTGQFAQHIRVERSVSQPSA